MGISVFFTLTALHYKHAKSKPQNHDLGISKTHLFGCPYHFTSPNLLFLPPTVPCLSGGDDPSVGAIVLPLLRSCAEHTFTSRQWFQHIGLF